jgi:hypothetical protein
MGEGHHFEQGPHIGGLIYQGETLECSGNGGRLCLIGLMHEACGALLYAQSFKKIGLQHRPVDFCAGVPGGTLQRIKIHMRAQICFTGVGERVNRLVA